MDSWYELLVKASEEVRKAGHIVQWKLASKYRFISRIDGVSYTIDNQRQAQDDLVDLVNSIRESDPARIEKEKQYGIYGKYGL